MCIHICNFCLLVFYLQFSSVFFSFICIILILFFSSDIEFNLLTIPPFTNQTNSQKSWIYVIIYNLSGIYHSAVILWLIGHRYWGHVLMSWGGGLQRKNKNLFIYFIFIFFCQKAFWNSFFLKKAFWIFSQRCLLIYLGFFGKAFWNLWFPRESLLNFLSRRRPTYFLLGFLQPCCWPQKNTKNFSWSDLFYGDSILEWACWGDSTYHAREGVFTLVCLCFRFMSQ